MITSNHTVKSVWNFLELSSNFLSYPSKRCEYSWTCFDWLSILVFVVFNSFFTSTSWSLYLFIPWRIRRIRFRNTIFDWGGCWEVLLMLAAELTDSMSIISDPVAEVEVVDHTSETLEPATEALEEHGESWPVPKMLVLPLTDLLLVGAERRKKVEDFALDFDLSSHYWQKWMWSRGSQHQNRWSPVMWAQCAPWNTPWPWTWGRRAHPVHEHEHPVSGLGLALDGCTS